MNEFDNITTIVDDYDLKMLELGFEKLQRRFAKWAKKHPKSVIYQALIDGELWQKYKGLYKDEQDRLFVVEEEVKKWDRFKEFEDLFKKP